jgi:hypothetical protein
LCLTPTRQLGSARIMPRYSIIPTSAASKYSHYNRPVSNSSSKTSAIALVRVGCRCRRCSSAVWSLFLLGRCRVFKPCPAVFCRVAFCLQSSAFTVFSSTSNSHVFSTLSRRFFILVTQIVALYTVRKSVPRDVRHVDPSRRHCTRPRGSAPLANASSIARMLGSDVQQSRESRYPTSQ